LIDQNADLLAELEMLNGGMYPAQAKMQVQIGAEWFRYYAGWCTKIDGIARDVNTGGLTGVDSHMHTYTVREPYGVVGLIFPWNGPVFNFCAKLAPALAAGCNAIVKPAEETPLSAHVLMRLLAEAGVPDGDSGQACVCGSRILVQRGVYDQVVEGMAAVANAMKMGAPDEEGVMSGPLISQKQLTRVLGYLDQGRTDGAEIVTGGHRLDRKGYFVHPTVVTNLDPDTSRLFQEEIFGPVVTILPFEDEDEAVALANNSTYGLAATVWTKELGRSHRLAKRLKAGTVGLNCAFPYDHSMPFGGYKQSGWGHESGKAGIEGYLQTKIVWAQM
jgi:acyl-CoA reductase-like NAD-dependent aldehyde dehydrogenase